MTTSLNRRYIPELDQLRALAALLVFFYHGRQRIGAMLTYGVPFDPARHWPVSGNPVAALFDEGHSGVGLFIVLSGFVLSTGAIGRKISYGRFLLARVIRIYPVLIVLGMAAISTKLFSIANIIAIVFPFTNSDHIGSDLGGQFWSVNVEFQCYLVFPFLIAFSDRIGTIFLVRVVLLAFVLRFLVIAGDGGNVVDVSYWTILGRLDQFCIGMIAARVVLQPGWIGRRAGWLLSPVIVILPLTLWAFNGAGGWPVANGWRIFWPPIEGGLWALTMLFYLQAGQSLPRLIAAPLTWLGTISYSFYLIHAAVITIVINQAAYLRITGVAHLDTLLTTVVVALPVTLGLATLLFHTAEQPFLSLRPRYVGAAVAA